MNQTEQSGKLISVCAVVVTYHPGGEVVENLRAIAEECGKIFVVDNGSAEEICASLAALPGIEMLRLGENLGVATALNRGLAKAVAAGFGWVITFDQDSKPVSGLVAGLLAAHGRHPHAAVIGSCIEEAGMTDSPFRWLRRHSGWPVFFQRVACNGQDLPAVTFVVSSGSLIELEVWRQLGGFDEELFIDYVDTDFCLRVLRAGRGVAVAAGARLRHQLGARLPGNFFGKDFRPMHHAAFRHYYQSRNRVRMWRRHALSVPHWALFDLSFACLTFFRVVIFESSKWRKFKAMLLGTWDGVSGRTGPCQEKRMGVLRT